MVGPGATPHHNFREAMEKFRMRALHWLGCTRLGAYFQAFGFNMCSLSVLSFISQLYLLPDEWEKEITQTALRYMHGLGCGCMVGGDMHSSKLKKI